MSTPNHPPPTLTSLPKDITSHITSFLDQTSLITFARVSRHCHQFLGDSIWEHLNLTLPVNFGQQPGIRPVDEAGKALSIYQWSSLIQGEAEEPHQLGLRDKIKQILLMGDKRKWSKVMSIRLDPRPAAALPLIQALDFASASLKSLRIEREGGDFPEPAHPEACDTFDFRLIHARLFFPVLTHLEIGPNANCTGAMVQLLCSISPNLSALQVNLERFTTKRSDTLTMPFPAFLGATQIRNMRFMWDQYFTMEDDERDAFIDLMKRSTLLRAVSLGFESGTPETMAKLVRAMRDQESIEILHWANSPREVFDLLGDDRSGFISLRRLVLYTVDWWPDVLSNVPSLPMLEMLYLEPLQDELALPILPAADTPLALSMTPDLATRLRDSPRLRAIHRLRSVIDLGDLGIPERLAEVDKTQPSAVIRSIRHGTEELIHLRILTEYVEVADMIGSFQGNISATSITTPYSALGGALRTKIYHQTDKARWEDYTDWKGLLVPLYVLQRAMEVDGKDAEGWTGRQVEVGEASWKVLTDWRDDVV